MFKFRYCPHGLVGILLLLFAGNLFAGGIESQTPRNSWLLYTIDGVSWARSGTADSVNLGGGNVNLYQASLKVTTALLAGLGIGYRWNIDPGIWTSLALEADYSRITSKDGMVRPLFFINTSFDTLKYNYTVRSTPLLLVAQIALRHNKFSPYLVVGAGVSANRASQYNERPSDPNNTAAPMRAPYRPFTEVDFACVLGAGLQFRIRDSGLISFEYRYTNFGEAHYDTTTQQTTTDTLFLGTIHSNAFLLRLSLLL